MKTRFWAAGIMFAFVIMFIVNIQQAGNPQKNNQVKQNNINNNLDNLDNIDFATAQEFSTQELSTQELSTQNFEKSEEKQFSGFVEYDSQIAIKAPFAGKIVFAVPIGSQINRGDTQFEIDSDAQKNIKNIDTKISNINKKNINNINNINNNFAGLDNANKILINKLKQTIILAQQNTIEYQKLNSTVENLHAQNAIETLANQVDNAENIELQELQELEEQKQDYIEIMAQIHKAQKSEIFGEVISSVDSGTIVEKDQNILSVGQGKKRIYIKVDSKLDIIEGMEAKVLVGNLEIPAKVGLVDSTAEIIPEKDFNLASNQKISVIIKEKEYSKLLGVPKSCILTIEEAQYLVLKENSEYKKIPVIAKIIDDKTAIIQQGEIIAGSLIALKPEKYLSKIS